MSEKEAANQLTDADFFSSIELDGLEDLITVDAPAEVVETVEQVQVSDGGDGDPPKVDDPPKAEEGDKPKETNEDDLITVDTPTDTEAADDPEKTKQDTEDPKKGGKADQEGNESPMYLHAAALQEYGLLPDFDLKDLNDLEPKDQFLKINMHIQKNAEESAKEIVDQELAKMGEAKRIYEDIQNGVDPEDVGRNESLEAQYGKVTVEALEDNEELQENMYSDYLFMKGLKEDKVKQLVDVAKDNGKLLVEATDATKEIQGAIKNEREHMRKQATDRKEQADKQNTETKEKINKTVKEVKEIIPGLELTEAEKKSVIKGMTVPVRYVKDANGQERPVSRAMDVRLKDPIAFEMRLNYFIEKGFFDKDAKFNEFAKQTESSAAKKFLDKIDTTTKLKGKSATETTEGAEKEEGEFVFPFQL